METTGMRVETSLNSFASPVPLNEKLSRPDVEREPTPPPAQLKTSRNGFQKNDTLNLSPVSELLSRTKEPPEENVYRADKVTAVSQAIAAGQYRIDSTLVAQRLLNSFSSDLFAT